MDKNDCYGLIKFSGIIICETVFSFVGIPIFGSIMIHSITEVNDVISQKRVTKLADEINVNIQRIDENSVDKHFLRSEEFHDFFVETLNCTLKERNEDKIKFFSKLLVDSIVNGEVKYNMDYVKALSELSYEQIVILKEMYNQQKDLPYDEKDELILLNKHGWQDLSKKMNDKYAIAPEDLTFLLKRVERTGFVYEVNGSYMSYNGGIYRITPTFIKLMKKLGSELNE